MHKEQNAVTKSALINYKHFFEKKKNEYSHFTLLLKKTNINIFYIGIQKRRQTYAFFKICKQNSNCLKTIKSKASSKLEQYQFNLEFFGLFLFIIIY